MKKFFSIVAVSLLMVSVASCGGSKDGEKKDGENKEQPTDNNGNNENGDNNDAKVEPVSIKVAAVNGTSPSSPFKDGNVKLKEQDYEISNTDVAGQYKVDLIAVIGEPKTYDGTLKVTLRLTDENKNAVDYFPKDGLYVEIDGFQDAVAKGNSEFTIPFVFDGIKVEDLNKVKNIGIEGMVDKK